jgi:hypothetical protein
VNLEVYVVNTKVTGHDQLLRVLSILNDLVNITSRYCLLNNFAEFKLLL